MVFSFSSAASRPLAHGCAFTQAVLEREAWRKALQQARGEKVYDDPKRLRRSLKKEKDAKRKSQAAWQGRVQDATKQSAQRQRKWVLRRR